ncbi:MAG: CTP synthase [Chlamydiia bacterium]|nr:CTP synthase [Chlamydiia bacterium]
MSIKTIFITGGVLSSLGKGVTAASLGFLLERMGLKIALIKLDPYLNIDPGTMNPYEHGEVYVTDDGSETDLDLGHYHRFTNSPLSKISNATSGQIYNEVIQNERRGKYLGRDVQVVPHITDTIKQRIKDCGKQEDGIDIVLVELGGTVGDIESSPFLEAAKQYYSERKDSTFFIHLTYLPFLATTKEIKTKPTQHSVQELQRAGVFPDFIFCRTSHPMTKEHKEKIAINCSVDVSCVFEISDIKGSIYKAPLHLYNEGILDSLANKLHLKKAPLDLSSWKMMIESIENPLGTVKIAVVGKYIEFDDAYKCIYESLLHSAASASVSLEVVKVNSENIDDLEEKLSGVQGVLIPGGFGNRGVEGKIIAASYCRQRKIPYFGICLGMQALCISFARDVLNMDADSSELNPNCASPVISLLSEQEDVVDLGGTMRLGAYPCKLNKNSKAYEAYQTEFISERHRHRYEFDSRYKDQFEANGCKITGVHPELGLVEIVEITDHPWMVGVQFHPEFLSKPDKPHPLFSAFVNASLKHVPNNEPVYEYQG